MMVFQLDVGVQTNLIYMMYNVNVKSSQPAQLVEVASVVQSVVHL